MLLYSSLFRERRTERSQRQEAARTGTVKRTGKNRTVWKTAFSKENRSPRKKVLPIQEPNTVVPVKEVLPVENFKRKRKQRKVYKKTVTGKIQKRGFFLSVRKKR